MEGDGGARYWSQLFDSLNKMIHNTLTYMPETHTYIHIFTHTHTHTHTHLFFQRKCSQIHRHRKKGNIFHKLALFLLLYIDQIAWEELQFIWFINLEGVERSIRERLWWHLSLAMPFTDEKGTRKGEEGHTNCSRILDVVMKRRSLQR